MTVHVCVYAFVDNLSWEMSVTLILETSLSLAWYSPSRLDGLQAPRDVPVSTSPVLGLQAHATVPGIAVWVLGDQTQVLPHVQQALYRLSHHPALIHYILGSLSIYTSNNGFL